jgi:hypothetical protein
VFRQPNSAAKSFLIFLTFSAFNALAQDHPSSQLKTYRDNQHDVRFSYPSSWTFDIDRRFFLTATIEKPDRPPLANVGFGDTLTNNHRSEYPNTNLAGVQFIYDILPNMTAEQCRNVAQPGGVATQERINGITFLHLTSENAAMCKQATEHLYVTADSNRCYLFDALIETICEDTIEGARNITPAELQTVKDQLHQIMLSVKIEVK